MEQNRDDDVDTELVIDLLQRRHDLPPERARAVLVGAARRKGVAVRDIVAVIDGQTASTESVSG